MSPPRIGPGRQLALDLPHRPALGRADFVGGAANAEALAAIDAWPGWPETGLFLSGPEGAGKSHLAAAFAARSGGAIVAAADLDAATAAALVEPGAAAIENLDRGPVDEAALFHLVNLARERKAALLLTSRIPAGELRFALPDLVSRLRAARPVALGAPDDDLLRRVLAKLFADRQIAVEPGVVPWLALRMERSLAAAVAVVARLDAEALEAGRPVTRQFAGEVFERMEAERQAEFWPAED